MNVNIAYKVHWQFKKHPHLKVTKCKKVINCKTNKALKYNVRGFYIDNQYLKRNEINKFLEKIPKTENCPF